MRQETINICKFDELKPEIQAKVIEKWREQEDHPFLQEDIHYFVNEQLQAKKIKLLDPKKFNVYYQLSYCQSDGLCFEGSFKWKQYRVYIDGYGNSCHPTRVNISVITSQGNMAKDSIQDEFLKIYKDICKKAKEYGYEAIEYDLTEDTIKETIQTNEYEFYEDGRFY